MTGCGATVVCLLLVGAAGPKARTGLLRADNPEVGACPLVGVELGPGVSGCRAQRVSGLVPVHWSVRLSPGLFG